jgi:hypothetical protein
MYHVDHMPQQDVLNRLLEIFPGRFTAEITKDNFLILNCNTEKDADYIDIELEDGAFDAESILCDIAQTSDYARIGNIFTIPPVEVLG